MSESRSFYVENFGCRAAQADGAALAADLGLRGMLPAAERAAADLVVVNTCTVTAEADRDARRTIRRIRRENPRARILVTGCYAQRRPQDLAALAGVDWIVGNSHKTLIGEVVAPGSLVTIAGAAPSGTLDYHGEISAGGTLVGDITEQRRLLASPVLDPSGERSRPNLKIQDGCNNRCSFCIIPSVRGRSRSAEAETVVEQVRGLAERYPEIVLSGINLGRWGRDLPGRPRFADLLRLLLDRTALRKLRISSVEPMDWTSDLLALVASSERIAKHFHIPLQSGSDTLLRAMRRRYRGRHYADRLARARALAPQAAIGADVMVGFPGETDELFDESRRFIEAMPLTYLHVFTYSAREGTAAAEAPNQVPKSVKKKRNRVLREIAAHKNLEFRLGLMGRRISAVTLADGRALTDNFVHVELDEASPGGGRLVEVEILHCGESSTAARIVG